MYTYIIHGHCHLIYGESVVAMFCQFGNRSGLALGVGRAYIQYTLNTLEFDLGRKAASVGQPYIMPREKIP